MGNRFVAGAPENTETVAPGLLESSVGAGVTSGGLNEGERWA